MNILHTFLTQKNKAYASWHRHPLHASVHWSIFLYASLFVTLVLLGSMGVVSLVPSMFEGKEYQVQEARASSLPHLKVNSNGRFLVKEDGTPFFWLGDTAWGFQKLSISEADLYLTNREQKGFNGIQVIFDWSPNINGDYPYINNNSDTPNEAFWQYMDQLVSLAENHGIYVAIAPLWGPAYNTLFLGDTAKAYRAGLTFGNRYKTRNNVLWIVSGEYDHIGFQMPITDAQKALFNSMAQGLQDGHAKTQLMTIHPDAAYTSSFEFHNESWLSFNMLQSGHIIDLEAQGNAENYTLIGRDYNLSPTKPVVDGEPIYEDVPDGISDPNAARAGSDVVRRKAYWAVLAGAMGHTYGHNDVWGFWTPGEPLRSNQRTDWKISLNAEGASQMRYLRSLIESRPFLNLIPDQSILASNPNTGINHVQAARASDGSYALTYIPTGDAVTIDMSKIAGSITARWFNPKDGTYSIIGTYANTGTKNFDAPGATANDNDWVLVLENTSSNPTPTPTPTPSPQGCLSPSPMPSGFAIPCPVFSVIPYSLASTGSLTLTITPPPGTVYIYKTIYVSEGNQWKTYTLPGTIVYQYWLQGIQTSVIPLSSLNLSPGTHYMAEWEWTWNTQKNCYTGPDTLCAGSSREYRIQRFLVL